MCRPFHDALTKPGDVIRAVVPPPAPISTGWLGALQNTARITGDLVAPVATPGDWDALRSK
jgi:hypothetical protein